MIPRGLIEPIGEPDPAGAARVSEAMLSMRKLELAAVRQAHAAA